MQLNWINRAKWVPYKNRFTSANINKKAGINYRGFCKESIQAISMYEEVMVPTKLTSTSEYIPLSKLK